METLLVVFSVIAATAIGIVAAIALIASEPTPEQREHEAMLKTAMERAEKEDGYADVS